MKRYAPLLTLLAVAVLGGVLLVVNTVSNPAARDQEPAAAQAPAPAAPPSTAPEPAVAAPAIAEKAWTGRSSGNEVTVAIAVKDGRAVGYVCDGEQIEAWLEGTLEGDRLTLQGKDGASITGTVDEAKSLGSVAIAGKQWPYAAAGVVAPAGLYEGRGNVDGVAERIGWIVLNDGTQTGIRVRAGESPEPAPSLDPTDLDGVVVDGAPFEVTAVGGDDTVIRR
jgi:hypothetical protein